MSYVPCVLIQFHLMTSRNLPSTTCPSHLRACSLPFSRKQLFPLSFFGGQKGKEGEGTPLLALSKKGLLLLLPHFPTLLSALGIGNFLFLNLFSIPCYVVLSFFVFWINYCLHLFYRRYSLSVCRRGN